MPHSDFSSSFGSEKLYGNTSIDPPNGLARCGEFVSVITSCRSASRRWAMYLPEKPKAPVTAIRTLAIRQHERITHSVCYRNAPYGWLFPTNRLRLWTGKGGNERARLSAPIFASGQPRGCCSPHPAVGDRNARRRAKSRQRVPDRRAGATIIFLRHKVGVRCPIALRVTRTVSI